MVPALMMIRPAPTLAGLLLISLASTAGVWLHGRAELSEVRQSHAAYVAQVERNAREASEAARVEEQRRKDAQVEIVQLARRSTQRAAEDLAHGVVVSNRLHEYADQLANRCAAPHDPAIATGGQTAPAAGAVLSHMLSRMEQVAGELAAFAVATAIAGATCEGAYNSLTNATAVH